MGGKSTKRNKFDIGAVNDLSRFKKIDFTEGKQLTCFLSVKIEPFRQKPPRPVFLAYRFIDLVRNGWSPQAASNRRIGKTIAKLMLECPDESLSEKVRQVVEQYHEYLRNPHKRRDFILAHSMKIVQDAMDKSSVAERKVALDALRFLGSDRTVGITEAPEASRATLDVNVAPELAAVIREVNDQRLIEAPDSTEDIEVKGKEKHEEEQ